MFKRSLLFIMFVFVVMLCSCVSKPDNRVELVFDTSFSYEGLSDDFHTVLLTDSHLVFLNVLAESFLIETYDLETGDKRMSLDFPFDERIIKGCDVTTDHLSCIGSDPKTDRLFVETYDFQEARHQSHELFFDQVLVVGENPIERIGNKVLINLESEDHEMGYVYLFDETDSLLTELSSYPIRHTVFHGTLEQTYGGANRVVEDMIVLASINYVLHENAVGLHQADGTGKRLLNGSEGCTVNHARIHETYVILNETCPDDFKLSIHDVRDDSFGLTIDFPFDHGYYVIRGIDKDHILFSTDEQTLDPKVYLYEFGNASFERVGFPEDLSSSFLIPISLMEDRTMFLSTAEPRTLSFLNLDDMRFEKGEDIGIDEVFGPIGRLMVFSGTKDGVKSLWSVDRVTGRSSEVTENWNDFSRVYLSDTHVVVVDRADTRVDVYRPDTT